MALYLQYMRDINCPIGYLKMVTSGPLTPPPQFGQFARFLNPTSQHRCHLHRLIGGKCEHADDEVFGRLPLRVESSARSVWKSAKASGEP